MDDWSLDGSPEPPRSPPPKMMDLNQIWGDADQSSLPSLPDPATDQWPPHHDAEADDDDQTFSSDLSLAARVQSSLQRSIPKNVLSHHLRQKGPLTTLHPNRPTPSKVRLTKPKPSTNSTSVYPDSKAFSLEHQFEQFKTQLAEANAKIADLTASAATSVPPVRSGSEKEFAKLQKTIDVLSLANTRLTEEKAALTFKLSKQSSQCETLEAQVQTSNAALDHVSEELQHCCSRLEETKVQLQNAQTDLIKSNAKCQELEMQLKQNPPYETRAIRDMRKSNQELHSRLHTLEEEHRLLLKECNEQKLTLEAKSKECMELTNAHEIRRHPCLEERTYQDAFVQTDSVLVQSVEIQTTGTCELDPAGSISKRLAGAREAEERTGLIRKHHEEINRLVQEYEHNTSDLERRHAQRLEEVEDQAAEEIALKVQQMRRSLTAEHQKRLDDVQRRYRTEISKAREERDRKIASLTDSLEAALAQVTATTEQLEQESQKRIALEGLLEALRLDFAEEKAALIEQHQQELEGFKTRAEEERILLLDSIERGCHEVIADSRHLSVAPQLTKAAAMQVNYRVRSQSEHLLRDTSPRSQSTPSLPASPPLSSESSGETPKTKDLHSPLHGGSSISLIQSLAETEAMVLKVLGNSRSKIT